MDSKLFGVWVLLLTSLRIYMNSKIVVKLKYDYKLNFKVYIQNCRILFVIEFEIFYEYKASVLNYLECY